MRGDLEVVTPYDHHTDIEDILNCLSRCVEKSEAFFSVAKVNGLLV